MMAPQELLALAGRIESAKRSDNALDVQSEIALFEATDLVLAIRSNDAGTKVIYTIKGGRDRTCWADDNTVNYLQRAKTAARLRSLATSGSQHEGASS